VIVLALLAVAAALQDVARQGRPALGSFATAVLAVAMLFTTGPTHAWRHSGIGAGRADSPSPNRIYLHNLRSKIQRSTVWETDGVESSVALVANAALAFSVNGKIDGNARYDAGTQVMSGLLGALLHGNVKRSMVIGLGTGSTAGWLGEVPQAEQVDVVELEPAILEVARRCAPVNRNVLENPKVHIHTGDAREVLLATPHRYDLIFSEPSNPYRAGIASLFTKDFYEAVEHRMNPGAVFLQWVQAYDVDGEAVRTVFATVGTVFPHVQTWRTQANDLILVATREPLALDAATLRERVATEPYRSAIRDVWRTDSLEGVLAHFLGNEELVRRVVAAGQTIATDDRNVLEFGFARGVGRSKIVNLPIEMVSFSKTAKLDRPLALKGEVNWERVAAEQVSFEALYLTSANSLPTEPPRSKEWREFFELYNGDESGRAYRLAQSAKLQAEGLLETEVLAEVCAVASDDNAPALIERLAAVRPHDAEALRGVFNATRKKLPEAVDDLTKAFIAWRTDPWTRAELGRTAIATARAIARKGGDQTLAKRLFDALYEPFCIENLRDPRFDALVDIAPLTAAAPSNPQSLAAMKLFGNDPDWRRDFLKQRATIFRDMKDPMFERAAADLAEYLDLESVRFDTGLAQPVATPEPKLAHQDEKAAELIVKPAEVPEKPATQGP
jgi:spermidine synthase